MSFVMMPFALAFLAENGWSTGLVIFMISVVFPDVALFCAGMWRFRLAPVPSVQKSSRNG